MQITNDIETIEVLSEKHDHNKRMIIVRANNFDATFHNVDRDDVLKTINKIKEVYQLKWDNM